MRGCLELALGVKVRVCGSESWLDVWFMVVGSGLGLNVRVRV